MEVTNGNGWSVVERSAQHGDVFCQHLVEDYDCAYAAWRAADDATDTRFWGDTMDRLTAQADAYATHKRSQA